MRPAYCVMFLALVGCVKSGVDFGSQLHVVPSELNDVGPGHVYWFHVPVDGGVEVEEIRKAEGVRKVAADGNDWIWFAWSHHAPDGQLLPHSGGRLYANVMIPKDIGRAKYSHGGYGGNRSSHVAFGNHVAFFSSYDDPVVDDLNYATLYCFSGSAEGQVEHEMLRNYPGRKLRLQCFGNGYAVVKTTEDGGRTAVWRTTKQMFVLISHAENPNMMRTYMRRFPSITPKDIDLSVDKWVRNEIRWRMNALDSRHLRRIKIGMRESLVYYTDTHLWRMFPNFPNLLKIGDIKETSSPDEELQYLQFARNWLWANRTNFKFDADTLGYILKGPDLYDTDNPPELPDEIKGPPLPTADQIAVWERAVAETERMEMERKIRSEIANLHRGFSRWLKHGVNPRNIYAPANYPQLKETVGDTSPEMTLLEVWEWMQKAQGWLWANRENLLWDNQKHRFFLTGADRYAAAHVQDLPEELRGPPRPSEKRPLDEQSRDWERLRGEIEQRRIDERMHKAIDRIDHTYANWLKSGDNPDVKFMRLNWKHSFAFPWGEHSWSRDLLQTWKWMKHVRCWLWANRTNFQPYDIHAGFHLKGPDLYDPKNPPKLPADLRGPPRPAATAVKGSSAKSSEGGTTEKQAPAATAR